MTPEEIALLLDTTFPELIECCKDPEMLRLILHLTYVLGKKDGVKEAHLNYNKAFKGYNAINITN